MGRMNSKAALWMGAGDFHMPYHDKRATECFTKAVRDLKPDHLVLGGDVLDCEKFSGHRRRAVVEAQAHDWHKDELTPAKNWVDSLVKATKGKVYFLEGNHEARIETWAVSAGVAGCSVYSMVSPKSMFSKGLSKDQFSYLPWLNRYSSKNYVSIGTKLVAVHGWSWCQHAASKHLELSRSRSIVYHHSHRQQRDSSHDPWNKQPIEAFNAGCMCQLQPIYGIGGNPSSWVHGFWIVYVSHQKPSDFTAYSIMVNRGRAILPDGMEIKV